MEVCLIPCVTYNINFLGRVLALIAAVMTIMILAIVLGVVTVA